MLGGRNRGSVAELQEDEGGLEGNRLDVLCGSVRKTSGGAKSTQSGGVHFIRSGIFKRGTGNGKAGSG